MSAIALNIEHLPSDVHRLVHETATELKGKLWANVVFGELSDPSYIGFDFDDIPDSYANLHPSLLKKTCHLCESSVAGTEEESLFEYEDSGEPAFYVCLKCQSDDTYVTIKILDEDED